MSLRSANIIAAIAVGLWLAIFAIGRDLTYHVYEQGRGIHPNAGQIDAYMVIPMFVALGLGVVAWVVNGIQRGFAILGAIAAATVFAILPYMLGYSGGV